MPQTEPLYRIKPPNWERQGDGSLVAESLLVQVRIRGDLSYIVVHGMFYRHSISCTRITLEQAMETGLRLWNDAHASVLERVEEEG